MIASVHIVLCLIFVLDKGKQRVARFLPFRYHHFFQFVARIHEGCREAVAHRQGVLQVEFERIVLTFAEESQLAAIADNDVGGCANVHISIRAHVGRPCAC